MFENQKKKNMDIYISPNMVV